MGLPLLLGLLFSRTGGLLPQSIEQPNSCITAERLCLADPACNATYQILENCSRSYAKNSFLILDHGARNKCLQAETMIRNSHFQECKCQRRTQRQEEQCLRIYWTVHSTVSEGDFNLEMSPYENVVSEESLKTNYNKLATQVSGSHLAGDHTNPCLQVAQVCSLNRRCGRLRTMYVANCSPKDGHPCNQRKCHQELKHFFGKVDMDFTKRFLFCPCQDEFCGERRRKTIVPDCSFQNSSKPNCLVLLDSCLKDYICKSRLADFQEQCKPSSSSSDGCFQHNHATCLEAYMGMIGTPMTPNYISNSTADVTLWCSCENSGNHKEDCEEILNLFSSNRCLRSAMQSQMGLNQVNTKDQEELQFISSPNIQGDGTSTVLTAKMYWESVKKTQPEVLMQNRHLFSHSVYSGDRLSLFTLTLTLLLLSLGSP
ncbi:PREDICTED: GDNF family receptor alpha-4-like [Gekko japonicus]|uniref:GDNF family receptor alpha-4-like n=1 Tax=Gekko japonicus TaxID=146911 RepID=A0ABM1JN25_GEKJA|nr:PREDICTED: GDNF family receptor alpha-4-like [Gekko japonicus]